MRGLIVRDEIEELGRFYWVLPQAGRLQSGLPLWATEEVSCVVRLEIEERALLLDTRVHSAHVRGQKRTVAASELRQGCSGASW